MDNNAQVAAAHCVACNIVNPINHIRCPSDLFPQGPAVGVEERVLQNKVRGSVLNMSLLKQIDERSATIAWSQTPQHANLVALGTKDGGGGGFDDYGGELEIHRLDFTKRDTKTAVIGSVRTPGRFSALAWSGPMGRRAECSMGVIAGGLADGSLTLWDSAKIVANHPQPRVTVLQRHQGPILSLHFNPNNSHVLASGGTDGEVHVLTLDRPDTPHVFAPPAAPHGMKISAEIPKVAWNSRVPHILGSCSGGGSTMVWDLRVKKPFCEMRDPARGPVADMAWNPDEPLHVVTASGDDNNPVVRLWDLRSSSTHPLTTLKGHDQGLLSVSWCPHDAKLLLTAGRDSKTLLWDLHSATPIYELPSAMPESDAYGVYGSSQQRRFSASWSPLLPAVIGTCSFNRTVEFYSLTGVRSSTGRAPKWLRRPVFATFGFGGKLTHIVTDPAIRAGGARRGSAQRPIASIRHMVEDEELVKASRAFQAGIATGDYKALCAGKVAQARTGEERQVWAVLQTVVDKDGSRAHLNETLGYDHVSSEAATDKANMGIHQEKLAAGALRSPLSGPLSPGNSASVVSFKLKSPGTEKADGWGFDKEDDGTARSPVSELANGLARTGVSPPVPGTMRPQAGRMTPGMEELIKHALLVGGLEASVHACLDHDLVAEALLLASAPEAGAELWAKTKDAYISRMVGRRPLLRIIDGILKSDLQELVAQSDLRQWQETLALINTFSRAGQFGVYSECLGARLESQKGDRASATLCYLCSLNVDKAVRYWVDSLCEAKARLGRTDTIALHYLVEKVTVLGSAIPDFHLPGDVSALFSEYAQLLAAQGELDIAYRYIMSATDIPAVYLRDRLFHASSTLRLAVPEPPRPFTVTPYGTATNKASPAAIKPSTVTASSIQRQQPQAAQAFPNSAVKATSYQAQPAPVTAAAGPLPLATPSLPTGWQEVFDPTSNRPYYYNQVTQESRWDPPPQTPSASSQPTQTQQPLPSTSAARMGSPFSAPTSAQHPASAARPLDYYADSFTSSHGNAALAQKYGNNANSSYAGPPQQAPMSNAGSDFYGQNGTTAFSFNPSGAAMPAMTPPTAQPTIFQPNKVALPSTSSTPSSTEPFKSSAATTAPSEPVAPAEIPPEGIPIMEALNRITQGLAANPALSTADRRQLGEVTKAVSILGDRLATNTVPANVLPKILHLAAACEVKDFASAMAVQTDFASSIWEAHKDWVKPMKNLINLCRK